MKKKGVESAVKAESKNKEVILYVIKLSCMVTCELRNNSLFMAGKGGMVKGQRGENVKELIVKLQQCCVLEEGR